MTRILATCTFCGDITLRVDEIVITDYGQGDRRYEFDCPVCETPMSRPADRQIISVLVAVGVPVIPAAPLPQGVVDALASLRAHASYDVEAEFKDELADVYTVADIGWEMSE